VPKNLFHSQRDRQIDIVLSGAMAGELLTAIDTQLTADCVETSPLCPGVLCCATYQLDKESGVKSGRLFAFRANTAGVAGDGDDEGGCDSGGGSGGGGGGDAPGAGASGASATAAVDAKPLLALEQEMDFAGGVLDMKWSRRCEHVPGAPEGAAPLLALALSNGSVELLRLNSAAGRGGGGIGQAAAAHLSRIAATPTQEAAALSLDWDYEHGDGEGSEGGGGTCTRLAVSELRGGIAVWQCEAAAAGATASGGSATATLRALHRWQAHALCGEPIEVWITAFSRSNPQMIYSGADDGVFKLWDIRLLRNDDGGEAGLAGAAPQRAALTSKDHGAGVCSLQCHPFREHVLATGSYDEIVRVWDERALGRGPVAQCSVGGGVWRLKWHPARERGDWLLAACMRGQARLLRLTCDAAAGVGEEPAEAAAEAVACTIDTAVLYEGHESEELTYGADWLRCGRNLSSPQPAVATCSFYDHALHVWRPSVDGALAETGTPKGVGSLCHPPRKMHAARAPALAPGPPPAPTTALPAIAKQDRGGNNAAVAATAALTASGGGDESWCDAAAALLGGDAGSGGGTGLGPAVFATAATAAAAATTSEIIGDEAWCDAAAAMLSGGGDGGDSFAEEEIAAAVDIASLGGMFDGISSSSSSSGSETEEDSGDEVEPYRGGGSPLLSHESADDAALVAALADIGLGAAEPSLMVPNDAGTGSADFAAACTDVHADFGSLGMAAGPVDDLANALQGLGILTPEQLGLPSGGDDLVAVDAFSAEEASAAPLPAARVPRGKPEMAALRLAAMQAALQEETGVENVPGTADTADTADTAATTCTCTTAAATVPAGKSGEAAAEECSPPGAEVAGIFDGITSSDDE
jgi:diphthamide biosynthesis protein 7